MGLRLHFCLHSPLQYDNAPAHNGSCVHAPEVMLITPSTSEMSIAACRPACQLIYVADVLQHAMLGHTTVFLFAVSPACICKLYDMLNWVQHCVQRDTHRDSQAAPEVEDYTLVVILVQAGG